MLTFMVLDFRRLELGSDLIEPRANSWLCAHKSPLAVLKRQYAVRGINAGKTACKASTSPPKLSLSSPQPKI